MKTEKKGTLEYIYTHTRVRTQSSLSLKHIAWLSSFIWGLGVRYPGVTRGLTLGLFGSPWAHINTNSDT